MESSRRSLVKASATVTAAAAGLTAPQAMSPARAQDARPAFGVPPTFIPVAGAAEVFAVRRIYCIGRNYAAHAREMGSDPTREPPFFFQKPTDAIQYVAPGTVADHPYQSLTRN